MANTDGYLKSSAIKRRALGTFFWGRQRDPEKVYLCGRNDSVALHC